MGGRMPRIRAKRKQQGGLTLERGADVRVDLTIQANFFKSWSCPLHISPSSFEACCLEGRMILTREPLPINTFQEKLAINSRAIFCTPSRRCQFSTCGTMTATV